MVLAPSVTYPDAHVNKHAGLPDAAPPGHEAAAVVVAAVTLMVGQIGPVAAAAAVADAAAAGERLPKESSLSFSFGGGSSQVDHS